MADIHQLWGGCACERNLYEIAIPAASAGLASVYFDNSSLSRRTQASPVTAWLRVPLDWYQSVTVAKFPDESHIHIKRTFHTPSPYSALSSRRQFCGYCGSHLTQWHEERKRGHTIVTQSEYLDITLGSLLHESLQKLEALSILPGLESDEELPPGMEEKSLLGGTNVHDEHDNTTGEESIGGAAEQARSLRTAAHTGVSHLMQGRGMPFFEEMVENSRFGRIKRQMGRQVSRDGAVSVSWEVIEMRNSPEPEAMTGIHHTDTSNKRQKTASEA